MYGKSELVVEQVINPHMTAMLNTRAGVKEGMWSRLSFHQVESRSNINIQIFISTTFGARAAQR